MIRDYDYPKSSLLAQVLEELISKEYIKLLCLRTNEILNDYIVNVYLWRLKNYSKIHNLIHPWNFWNVSRKLKWVFNIWKIILSLIATFSHKQNLFPRSWVYLLTWHTHSCVISCLYQVLTHFCCEIFMFLNIGKYKRLNQCYTLHFVVFSEKWIFFHPL